MSEARPTTGRRLIAAMSGASLVQSGGAAAAGLWATIVLGAEARGVMVVAVTTTGLVALSAGLGTGSAYRSLLPTAEPAERPRLAVAYGTVSVVAGFVAAAVSVGILALAALGISDDLAAPRLLAVGALGGGLQCLSFQTNEGWWADGQFTRGAALAAAGACAGLGGLVVAGAFSATPTSMLGGQVLGEGTITVVSMALLHRAGLFRLGRGAGATVRRLVRIGWPTLGVGVGTILTFRADRYLIGIFSGTAAITVYSLAATMSEVTRTVPHALGQVLIRRIATRDPSVALRRTVTQAVIATALTGLAIGSVGWVAITVVFDRELLDARVYLLLLLGAEVLFAPFFVASRGLIGGGWTRTTGAISVGGCVLAVGSYLVLVPPFGLVGACLASAVSYLALSIATVTALSGRLRRRDPVGQTADRADRDRGPGDAVIRHLLSIVRDEWQIARDPVGYARRMGVTLADDCWLAGLTRGQFGTEPFLITMGEHVAIAAGVRFITHDGGGYVFRLEFPDIEAFDRITIEDNVMVGMNAILLPGTHIGSYSVIAAGAVVTGTVPPGSVYGGVPAKFICTTEEYREKLLARAFFHDPMPPDERREAFLAFLDGRVDNRGRPIEPA